MTILLAITFVFGVLRLLTWTKLFDSKFKGVFDTFNMNTKFWKILDILFYMFCLIFQAYHWLFQQAVIY